MIRCLLTALLVLGLTYPAWAQDDAGTAAPAIVEESDAPSAEGLPETVPGLDERINAAVTPVANRISRFIFKSVPVNGTEFPLIVGWLILAGFIFTLYFRFINIRAFGHAFRLVRGDYDDKRNPGEVTYFQGLSSAVSGTVGLGNIAGVAVAITIGGPGATLWMILAGLLGMSTKFVECTLGLKYRLELPDGSIAGGPMYYLSRGLKEHYPKLGAVGWILAVIFAVCTMLGAIGAGGMFQANQAYAQLASVTGGFLGDKAALFGLVYAVAAGAVLIGGISRIGQVTSKLVPSMAALYILAALIVLGAHVTDIPAAVMTIIDGAFSPEGVVGGVVGALIQGFRRAAFSNEAGLGSSAIAHSTIRTREPASAGIVALFEPFVDTVVICSMTALVIVITGAYVGGEGVEGVRLTSAAFATVMPWFPYVLAFLVLLFAFSTTITWGYYGAKAASFLARESKAVLYGFKFFYLLMVVVGCTMQLSSIVDIADGLLFIMAIPNLIGLYLLAPVVKREVNSYMQRLRSGSIVSREQEQAAHP